MTSGVDPAEPFESAAAGFAGPGAGIVEPVPTAVDGRALSKRGIDTRRRLLEAAEQVFADLGYHDASIVKLTEAAGVAQGTFYQYFCSKKEIFEELMRDLNRRVRRAMAEGAAAGESRAEQEQLGFQAFFRFTAEHRALYRIIRQAEFVSPETLHFHYEKLSEGYIEGLREAMARGEIPALDPEVLAWALMGIGELIGMKWILWDGREELPADVFEQLKTVILRVLGVPA
jgi:AcrR family transcriptional regulator